MKSSLSGLVSLIFLLFPLMVTDNFAQWITKCHSKLKTQIENFGCTCLRAVCIRKCCPNNQALSGINDFRECVEGGISQENIWERKSNGDLTDLVGHDIADVHLVEGIPCEQHFHYDKEDHFAVSRNGKLVDENTSEFCLEFVPEHNVTVPFICVSGEAELRSQKQAKLNAILFWSSISFLLITFFVHIVLRGFRTSSGKLLLSYLLCILSYNLLSNVPTEDLLQEKEFVCKVVAYLRQYSARAGFFWLSTMGFDLWMTFRKSRQSAGMISELAVKKFTLYSLHAWGCPLIISGVMILAEFLAASGQEPNPQMLACWFESEKVEFWYFCCIKTILVIASLFMFMNSAYNFCTLPVEKKGQESNVNDSENHNEQLEERFILSFELLAIMVLNWTAELLYQTGVHILYEIWRVTNVANFLQCVFVFLTFVCQKNVLIRLIDRLWSSRISKKETGRRSECTGETTKLTGHVVVYRKSDPVFDHPCVDFADA